MLSHSLDLIYGGLLLKDNNTLESYGLKDGSTVHMVKRPIEVEPIGMWYRVYLNFD